MPATLALERDFERTCIAGGIIRLAGNLMTWGSGTLYSRVEAKSEIGWVSRIKCHWNLDTRTISCGQKTFLKPTLRQRLSSWSISQLMSIRTLYLSKHSIYLSLWAYSISRSMLMASHAQFHFFSAGSLILLISLLRLKEDIAMELIELEIRDYSRFRVLGTYIFVYFETRLGYNGSTQIWFLRSVQAELRNKNCPLWHVLNFVRLEACSI